VIIADEPVSALDVSIQAQVMNLLMDLCDDLGLSYVFISHDLAVVRQIADNIMVMYLGKVMEYGPAEQIYSSPRNPYTAALLSAVPVADPVAQRTRQRILLTGDLPSPADPPAGCRFCTRCYQVQELCRVQAPPLVEVGHGQVVACHFPLSDEAAEAIAVV
jgi:oligopeptide/dipeptide ABC transporter ATP-binding protein